MRITEKTWVEYIGRLSRLNAKAGQEMAAYLAKHGTGDTAALIDYAYALAQKYGEGSAELACQMYDAIAEASGADVPAAEPADPASYDETANMVYATQNSPPLLQSGVSRLVKQAGADTTLKNAIRDGAEWAWVPHGDTCPFCITLASNGWQPASEKALKGGHAQHIHANCDCEYAVRFDSRTTVAGYDPDKYLEQYYAYGGDINAMRRAQYAKNKDFINAQKRAAYAARKARSGPVDVLEEYLRTAKPGQGSITYDKNYNRSKHTAEIKTAQWLHDHLGGDIELLQETGGLFEKTPDFRWRGKGWELKTTTTEKSADSALRSALKQIYKNPGGVILDYGDRDIDPEVVMDIVKRRLLRQEQCNADILIIQRDKLKAALRYKK